MIDDKNSTDQALIRLLEDSLQNALINKERYRLPNEMIPTKWFWHGLIGGILMSFYIFGLLLTCNSFFGITIMVL